jgi:alpha-1,6-mannosyltransferase
MRPVPLWLLALFSLLGYVLIAVWFPLDPGLHRAPLPDIRTFTPSLGAGLAYGAWLVALFALYGLAYRRAREEASGLSLPLILLATALFCLPLVLTFPINATDVYRYFVRGRMTAVYRLSPFSYPPAAVPSDPYLSLAGEWAGATSPYGPVWELVAGGITALSGGNVQFALCLFKGLGALLHLAVAALLWLGLRGAPPARRTARTLLWAWNPALLLISVVDGHNDVLMLFWLLLGTLLVQHGRYGRVSLSSTVAGLTVMTLAPLTKLAGLLPLPLFYLAVLRRLPDARSRIRLLGAGALGTLIVAVLAFMPFARSAGTLLELVRRLQQEVSGSAGFSAVALAVLAARRLNLSFGLNDAVMLAGILFALFALWSLWRMLRGASPVRATADLFGAYLVQAANYRIWYAAWPYAWLLLDEESAAGRLAAGTGLLLTSQLSVLIHAHVRTDLLGGDHLVGHLVGVPFVFLVPLGIGWFWRRRRGRG